MDRRVENNTIVHIDVLQAIASKLHTHFQVVKANW